VARKQLVSPPEEGSEAPEFNLPGAQGGQLRLGLRTVRGPVVVVFYRGAWSEECAEYFRALAERDREINVAGATIVGIGPAEPEEAREFVRETGFKSYVLYDYVRRTTREYGLLQKDAEHGDAARPAVFLIGTGNEVIRAWLDERPAPGDLLAEVSKITGLPKEPEEGEAEEKPKRRPRKAAEGETAGDDPEGGGKTRPAKSVAPGSGDTDSDGAKSGGAAKGESASEGGESSTRKEASAAPAGGALESPEGGAEEGEKEPVTSEEGGAGAEPGTGEGGAPPKGVGGGDSASHGEER